MREQKQCTRPYTVNAAATRRQSILIHVCWCYSSRGCSCFVKWRTISSAPPSPVDCGGHWRQCRPPSGPYWKKMPERVNHRTHGQECSSFCSSKERCQLEGNDHLVKASSFQEARGIVRVTGAVGFRSV